ncbi:hypothetical protein [Roseospira visakhapatnamensis]|uniref:Uncharacterized protein n=1 Tax=Roseospira visakhapatnamensis TaxID=390880 RepID=A0A7W6W876_9PROT|nr:hypothetical protein [Roseospira visakhapatnamensis]MBB4264710.1 hypothetical protein [Roseospira visakhapatnamensis]
MIVRMLLDGLLSLGRPTRPATMRVPWTTSTATTRNPRQDGHRVPAMAFRGRPDLMLVTGAMSAPAVIPPRALRGRHLSMGGHGAA